MKIISSWEDGSIADLKMAELMSKYDIPTIFYWISSPNAPNRNFDGHKRLTEENQKELAKQFEIGSHSSTHQPMCKMSIDQLAREITDSRKFWQDFTGQEINSFAYPKKSITSLAKCLIKGAGYKNARTSVPGHLSPGNDPFDIQCTVQVAIDRLEYNNKCWEFFWEEMLEKSNENSVFHIFGNSWDVELFNDWDNLERLLKKFK